MDPVIEFVQQFSSQCPRCRYSLRGISKPECPECGCPLILTLTPDNQLRGNWILLFWLSALGNFHGLVFLALIINRGANFFDRDVWQALYGLAIYYTIATIPLSISVLSLRRRFCLLSRPLQKAAVVVVGACDFLALAIIIKTWWIIW